MAEDKLNYNFKNGELYVWPLSKWDGLLLDRGGRIGKIPAQDGGSIQCIIFSSDKVKEAQKLVDNINSEKQKYRSKIGDIIIDGKKEGLTLIKYGNGLALYGVSETDRSLHEKLKGIGATYNGGIRTLLKDVTGGWVLNADKLSKITNIVNKYNANKVLVEPSETSEPTEEAEVKICVPKENENYQTVTYYLEKPRLNQKVTIHMLGKTINTKVISIVPNTDSNVIDLIQLENHIAAIIAGRWELLYETNDHMLTFH